MRSGNARWATLIAIAALSYCSELQAEFMNGNQLYKFCSSRGIEGTVCRGYVMGIVDAYNADKICVPSEVTASQVADIVDAWLFDHPESRHQSGASLVLEAIGEKFPCKEM